MKEPLYNALKGEDSLPANHKFEDLFDTIEEENDEEPAILHAYIQRDEDEDEIVFMMFNDQVSVIHNQLLERIRDLGYEVYAFGNNYQLYGNPTAAFTTTGEQ